MGEKEKETWGRLSVHGCRLEKEKEKIEGVGPAGLTWLAEKQRVEKNEKEK